MPKVVGHIPITNTSPGNPNANTGENFLLCRKFDLNVEGGGGYSYV